MRSWMHGPLSWNLRRNGFAPVRVSILDGLRDHIRWWVESGDPGGGGVAETGNRLPSWRLVSAILLALLALAWSNATRPYPAP